jgi:hypothetical protein
MDAFELHLLQEEQHRRMTAQNSYQNAAGMLEKGFKPMITKDLKVIWGELVDGKMVPYMATSKNAQGIDVSNPVPLEVIFVGNTCNPQLTSMGNTRFEKSAEMVPSQMHYMDGGNAFQECQFQLWEHDPMVDIEANEGASGFSKSKAKQGITLVAPPTSDDFGARTILERIFGKRGLVIEAMAYFASLPENRAILTQRFAEIARSYGMDQQSSIYRAVFDDLTGKSNGYHFGYEGRGGAVTLPVYGNLMFESVKKDRDGKRIKPDNEKYLTSHFDNTGGLQQIFKKFYPRATYRYLKKTDVRGQEVGFSAGEQDRLHKLHNPIVAMVVRARIYFNTYNSFTLDVEPDHSGVKILYDGDKFTESEIATFEEWKLTGAAPPRFQVNMAMASDLSQIGDLAKSSSMQTRREEFYRARGIDSSALAITDQSDAAAFFASVDQDDETGVEEEEEAGVEEEEEEEEEHISKKRAISK